MRLTPSLISLPVPVLWATESMAQAYTDRALWWHLSWASHTIFGGLMMIAFWGGIVGLIVLLARRLGGAGAASTALSPASRSTPLEVLQERFAKGEIERQEYEERRKLLLE